MTQFAPWPALFGGALIGLAAVLLLAGAGRIAGVSGVILNMFAARDRAGFLWRLAFVAGLPLGALLMAAVGAKDMKTLVFPADTLMTLVAGLLVGVGTTFGSGCTSGHGVCGVARLSVRSIVATLIFMATGVATVFVVRHLF